MNRTVPFAILAFALSTQVTAAEEEESHITVIEGENVTIYEHHSKDDLRERVEVDPDNGRPYVLLDSDGNGALDSSGGDPRSNDGVMMWSIRKW